jgi:hypothetical protein
MRDDSPDLAGPPYDLDPAVLQVSSENELVERHLSLLDTLATQYTAIENDPEFTSHHTHTSELANLRNYDKRRRDLFSTPPNV